MYKETHTEHSQTAFVFFFSFPWVREESKAWSTRRSRKKKRRQKQERKEVGLPFRHLKLDCDSGATWKQVPRSSLLLHSCFFGLFWISLVCLLLLLTFLLLLLLFTHFWHSPSDRLTDCYEGLQFCICCYCCSYYYYHHSCCCVYCCFSVSVYKHGKHIFRYLSRYYM